MSAIFGKNSLFVFLFILINHSTFCQGTACDNPYNLNADYPIEGNGYAEITVDNTSSNQFYSYTATQAGTIEMSSCLDNSGIDTYLRVYQESCDNLFFESDQAGCFGNVESVIEVNIGDTYIFEWSNQKEGGALDARFYFHEPVAGSACDDPIDLTEGSHTKDYWFGNQYYSYTSDENGSLEVNTCGLADDISIIIYDACDGNILAETDPFLCPEDPNYDLAQARTIYEISENETVTVEVGPYGSYTEFDFDFNVIFNPLGESCHSPFDLSITPGVLHEVPHACTTCRSDKWYKFTAPKDGAGIVTTGMAALAKHGAIGGQEQTYIQVYDTCEGELITENNDYYQFFGSSLVNIEFVEGEDYYVKFIAEFINDPYDFDIFYEVDLIFGTEEAPLDVVLGLNDEHANMYYAGAQYEIGEQWFEYEFPSDGVFTMEVTNYYNIQTLLTIQSENDPDLIYPDDDSGPSGFSLEGVTGDLVKFGLSRANNTFSTDFDPLCKGAYTQLDDGDLGDEISVDNTSGDHIFRYTATMDGTLFLSSCGLNAEIDTYVKLYELCEEAVLAESDDFCRVASRISFPVTNGTTYEIVWDDINIESVVAEFEFYFNYLENIPGQSQADAIDAIDGGNATNTDHIEEQWFSFILPDNGFLDVYGFAPDEVNNNSLLLSTANEGLINIIDPHNSTYIGLAGDEVFIVWNSNFNYQNIAFQVSFSPAVIWTAGEWSNETGPEEGDNVLIADIYSTDFFGSFPVNQLIISETGELEVGLGTSLDVKGDVINRGVINIHSGASFLTYEANSITGNDITIKRNTRYANGKYSFVGTPVEQNGDVSGSDLGSSVYKYNEEIAYGSDGINRWESASSDELMPAKGYTQANRQEITFNGVPNDGGITYVGTYTEDEEDANEGWSLVANPYVAAINVADFLAENTNIEGAVYIWDDNGSDEQRGSNEDYIVANGTMTTNTTPAGGEGRYNLHLGSAQGFFVKLNDAADTDIDFTEEMRVAGDNADDNFFRKSELPIVRVNLSNSKGLFKQAVVGVTEDADNTDLNRKYDAQAFKANALDGVFAMKAGRTLALSGVPNGWKTIQLQLNTSESGLYTLGVELENYNDAVFLRDHLTNEIIDLRNDSYTFTSSEGIHVDRFELVSNPSTVLGLEESGVLIYASNKTLYIDQSDSKIREYELFDLNGKSLLTKSIVSKAEINLANLPSGVYLVFDGQKTHKIILD